MTALSFLIAWAGYSVMTWGIATVRSCNVTWSQVSIPGKFVGCNPDGASGSNGTPPVKDNGVSLGNYGTLLPNTNIPLPNEPTGTATNVDQTKLIS